jgi:hypothetical protein
MDQLHLLGRLLLMLRLLVLLHRLGQLVLFLLRLSDLLGQ